MQMHPRLACKFASRIAGLLPAAPLPRHRPFRIRNKRASRRRIPPRGIIDIFIRRAASTSIRTCRRIVSFMRSAASAANASADALKLTAADAPPDGFEIVPTYDAKCLVAYLMSLDQSHPLKEVKSGGARAPAIPAPSPAPGNAAATEMNEKTPDSAPRFRQGMDYGEHEDVQEVHAAIQREKREPRVGLEPLSIWLIAVYGLAVFFGGAYLGRYSGNFSGDGLDPLGGPPAEKRKARRGPGGGEEGSGTISGRARQKVFLANCAVCHQPNGLGSQTQGYPPLAGSEYVNGGSARNAMIVLKGLQGPVKVKGQQFGTAVMQPWDKTLNDQKNCRRAHLHSAGMGQHRRSRFRRTSRRLAQRTRQSSRLLYRTRSASRPRRCKSSRWRGATGETGRESSADRSGRRPN